MTKNEMAADSVAELRDSLSDLFEELQIAIKGGHVQWASNLRGDIRWCEQSIARLSRAALTA